MRNFEKSHFAQQHPQRRHDDVVHQRGDDLAECRPDHHSDRQIDDAPFDGEFLELLDIPTLLSLQLEMSLTEPPDCTPAVNPFYQPRPPKFDSRTTGI